ncbi:MAG TPA: DNA topoisomerase IB [Nocardioidaceae bacterium]|nr:DNA topoisomerase IB [Nocardioidaceae bacterium]
MTRLRRVSCQDPGWKRIRSGRGFRYVDEAGRPLDDAAVQRVKDLVIPPAWSEVWICSDEKGHLQAVGTDDAGRRQYLYHPAWRERQDAAKFDRVLEMARELPRVRRRLRQDLKGAAVERPTVVAAAVRLVDLGCFRLGSEVYTDENGSYGLTTLERRHVRSSGESLVFAFVGKSGVEHDIRVDDAAVCRVVRAIASRRKPDSRLLAYREQARWRPVTATDINERIRELVGMDVTAKDFRTWHGTVMVADALSRQERASSRKARAKQVKTAVDAAADLLGNTPTVARSSYVDPRVIDLFEAGRTIEPKRGQDALDRAVVALLDEA